MCAPFKLLGKGVFLFLNSFKCSTRQIEDFVISLYPPFAAFGEIEIWLSQERSFFP